MAIEIECPGCQQCYESPDRHAGKEIPCPNCGGPIRVRALDSLDVECADCGQSYASPARHAGKTIECPACGGAIKVPRLQETAERGNGQMIRNSAETIEIVCPGCSRRYALPKRAAGRTVNCPQCQTAIKVPGQSPEETAPECTKPGYKEMRERNLATLGKSGFTVAPSLAIERSNDELRPAEEIAKRFWALGVFCLFVTVAEETVSTAAINECQKSNALAKALTRKERAMFAKPRGEAHERFADMLGWHVENMVPLAWILGFDVDLGLEGTKIGEERIEKMLFEFMGDVAQPVDDWIEAHPPRDKMAVIEKEDLFYCAHSAVRQAQFGDDTLPEGFHPVINGGVILERRHGLTWAISPAVSWDDTDMST